ncbi:MAG TPA: DUF4058 family protein [Chthonomonadaceae bacterium]|nr:DUF4058 family protein [Chthonomonadaceae bacterium]
MPGPFPGMDPWLEDPVGWGDVHDGLIGRMRAALNAILPPEYVARGVERCYVVQPERDIVPDLTIHRQPPRTTQKPGSGGIALASDPSLMISLAPLEMRETYIEILSIRDSHQIVTVMEVLSPSNKAPNSKGLRLYRKKQREVVAARKHLIEIDLLRAGEHVVMVPRETLLRETRWDYLVCLYRAGQPQALQVWPTPLRERLPRIDIPLDVGVQDVVLDLQEAFDRNYEEGAYIRDIDYRREPIPPLGSEDAAWADALLRERGLRS